MKGYFEVLQARVGMGQRRGYANGKGERGPQIAKARSGRHLADRPESRDKDPSPRHPPGRRRLAGKMPARTGRMPALPRNATQQSLLQFSRQRRRGAEKGRRNANLGILFCASLRFKLWTQIHAHRCNPWLNSLSPRSPG